MHTARSRRIAVGLFVSVVGAGCATATHQPANRPAAVSYRDAPTNAADVEFMSGMIPHHAQAVIMAGWAESHGARADVAILCGRIAVAQRDEIAAMQTWLRDRGEPVPDAASTRMHMSMGGMEMDMLMPGMLSDAEMATLDKARGAEFDRLFLIGMIKHHQGAIDMVEVLFKAPGAAQDDTVFKFANDVQVDQATEIDRMRSMLAASSGGRHLPSRSTPQH